MAHELAVTLQQAGRIRQRCAPHVYVQSEYIDAWMKEHAGELGAMALQWFEVMRKCGDEVREIR
jgi:hypothetical protein